MIRIILAMRPRMYNHVPDDVIGTLTLLSLFSRSATFKIWMNRIIVNNAILISMTIYYFYKACVFHFFFTWWDVNDEVDDVACCREFINTVLYTCLIDIDFVANENSELMIMINLSIWVCWWPWAVILALWSCLPGSLPHWSTVL